MHVLHFEVEWVDLRDVNIFEFFYKSVILDENFLGDPLVMKKHFFALLGVTAALSWASLSSVAFAEEADQNGISDPNQSMNAAPDADASAGNGNNAGVAPTQNNNAMPNQDDAHEDTANSGDDDY